MRWFGGFVANDEHTPVLVPQNGVRLLWSGPLSLWTVGHWDRAEIVHTRARGRAAVLIGVHRITAELLNAWLRQEELTTLPSWPGSYTVVVRDRTRVTVFTDPGHATPIYHAETGDGTAWASSSRALAPLTGNTIDPVWMAAAITAPAGFTPGTRSAFTGVLAARPGHRLTLSPRQSPSTLCWWSTPGRLRAAEAAQGFRGALEEAVSTRSDLGQRISCDLSGGLDSTTLCLLAAGRSAPGNPMTALTVRPDGVDQGGDLDYARTSVRGRVDVTHLVVPLGADADPYTGLGEIGLCDEPAPTTITAARHRIAYEYLTELEIRRHITGDGGDALLIPPPGYTAELLRHRPFRALRDVHGWAKLSKGSPWPGIRRLLTSTPAPIEPAPWSTPHARRLAAESLPADADRSPHADAEVLAEIRGAARTAHADVQLAEPFGILPDAPFTDRTVIDAALRFPLADRGSPWSYKPQISTSMSGVLPPVVRGRQSKGGTDADHHRGMRTNLSAITELADGWLTDHELTDPLRLRAALQSAAAGLPAQFGVLGPTIAAEVWARSTTAAAPVRWTRARFFTTERAAR